MQGGAEAAVAPRAGPSAPSAAGGVPAQAGPRYAVGPEGRGGVAVGPAR